MNNCFLIFALLVISSVAVNVAVTCTANGRIADPSDPCGRTYVVCLWSLTQFLSWTLKCPAGSVFNQPTSKCASPTAPLPASCSTTPPTTPVTTNPTIEARPAAPTCIMNGNLADPSDTCGQSYVVCAYDGTGFISFPAKCPGGLVFDQKVSECVQSTTPLPSSCLTTAAPAAAAPTTAAPSTAAPTTAAPTTAAPTTATPTAASPTTAAPTTASPTTAAPTTATPTAASPTTAAPTTASPTTAAPTTVAPTTAAPTTAAPTTAAPTTAAPTTAAPTTAAPTTAASTTAATTTAATTTCIMNGRFADPSDPCGQSYILCSWDGAKFLMWKLKCPNQLVFFQATSKCVRSATPLPATC